MLEAVEALSEELDAARAASESAETQVAALRSELEAVGVESASMREMEVTGQVALSLSLSLSRTRARIQHVQPSRPLSLSLALSLARSRALLHSTRA